ncbi:major facilitator superfamily domain-containing protein [Dactylonectria estremocensis]|uniref:Major facilitator superfamily domain-containing protein n=1 Tax=Dactylonectria estremocensis TaxID=1079267 RepID=A0A9P9ENI2_9HYPO|nr:major facilitator superfamily domain-containing protein [Dactylonectria estremocensis]
MSSDDETLRLDTAPRQTKGDSDLEKGKDEPVATIPSSSKHSAQGDAEKTSDHQDEEQVDPDIVWWDSDSDPENPLNWPKWRKISNCGLISMLTLIEPLASSIFAPGIPELMRDFGSTNSELGAFVMSVYVLGFAFGPMLLAPLSEMVGRVPVYHACNVFFLAFTVACAVAPSLNTLIVFRFLAGTFGAAPMTNGGGSIADMFRAEDRAGVMAVFSVGPLIGPIIGPVIGGVLTEAMGWRWDFWVIVMVAGAITVGMAVVMRETYAPVILERKAQRLRKETGNDRLRSKLDTGLSHKDNFKRCIVRPAKLLIYSPICIIFAAYLALIYGYLYLLFSSVPFVFEDTYGFSTKTVGLVYLGLGIGSFVGMGWFAYDSNKEVKKQMAAGTFKPEVRLKLLPFAAVIYPIGFFIYGWTADYVTHWIGPVIGLAVIGVGNLLAFMPICVYLVDAFEMYAASALAANTIMRSIAGAVLPLCGLRMYDALGLGWGNSMLGFISVALIPIPFIIQRYGEKLRKKYEIKDL